jgi:hypothetical protein
MHGCSHGLRTLTINGLACAATNHLHLVCLPASCRRPRRRPMPAQGQLSGQGHGWPAHLSGLPGQWHVLQLRLPFLSSPARQVADRPQQHQRACNAPATSYNVCCASGPCLAESWHLWEAVAAQPWQPSCAVPRVFREGTGGHQGWLPAHAIGAQAT